MKYKSVFISDLHLGSRSSSISSFLNFIKNNEFDNLYLVGDIIDLIALKRKVNWSTNENLVIQKLLRLSRRGVVIYYIPGNHDSSVGIFDGESFGNIHIKREMVIDTGKEKVLVVHGDEFDIVLRSMVYLYSVGEFIYDFLVDFNPLYIRFRKILGMRGDFSLSYYLKHVSRNIIEYLSKYEKLIAKKAEMNGCGVVICGHSHFAEDRIIDGIRYMNCGSWTIDNTASLIVDNNGTLELIRYRD